jgi:uncharacterized protein YecE (DUF72 family)
MGAAGALIRVGTAGWGNPPAQRALRPSERSQLEHYASHFNCVEINSSFARVHRRETYERWAASSEREFRFAVKFPRSISHESELRPSRMQLEAFLDSVEGLGVKLGALLLQLPPRSQWQPRIAARFFTRLRARTAVPIVCEPRHPSWSVAAAERLLARFGISLVVADPARLSRHWSLPGAIRYYRLHGAPRIYWSSYSEERLRALADALLAERAGFPEVWCIFDNTAAGAAWSNAAALGAALRDATRTEAVSRD